MPTWSRFRELMWMRQGVHEAEVTLSFPTPPRWLSFLDSWAARRIVRRAIRQQTPIHMVVDAARMVDADEVGWRTFEGILQWAVHLQVQGALRIVPLRDAASALNPGTQAARLHSILRPAA